MPQFILCDPTEERHLPQSLKDYIREYVSGLEELTGSDFIITPLALPAKTDAMIRKHAESGLCIQRKDVGDLLASIQDNRMWGQLDRMKQVTPTPFMFLTGDLKCDRNSNAVVDGRDTQMNYYAVQMALFRWQMCGGYILNPSRDTVMADMCRVLHSSIVERMDEGGWPDKSYSRPVPQMLYEVPSVQRTLLTFPGLGSDRAEAVYQFALGKVDKPTLMDCMIVLQDEKIEGIGKVTQKRVLDFIGWQDVNDTEKESR